LTTLDDPGPRNRRREIESPSLFSPPATWHKEAEWAYMLVGSARITAIALLVGLTAVAGTLDALALLRSGGLVLRAAASLAAFLAGATVGARLIGTRVRPEVARTELDILVAEAFLLGTFAALWLALGTPADHPAGRVVPVALAAAAMGLQVALTLALKVPNVLTAVLDLHSLRA
jgi:hypothetical protein